MKKILLLIITITTLTTITACNPNNQQSMNTPKKEAINVTKKETDPEQKNPEPEQQGITVKTDKYELTDVKIIKSNLGMTVTGILKNNSGKDMRGISLQFPIYDTSGNKTGNAMDMISDLKNGETWKFEAHGFKNGNLKIDLQHPNISDY